MAALTGTGQPVQLGSGYAIRAPGIRGTANVIVPRTGDERSRGRLAEDGTADLDRALEAANMTEVRQVQLELEPLAATATTAPAMRSADGQEIVELDVPDLGPDHGQVVLCCDETGVLTWHLPVDTSSAVETPATRGAGGVKRFLVPATRTRTSYAEADKRSLARIIGKKLLKILIYPVLDPVVGAISESFAGRWEAKHRPYGLRGFSPADRRTVGAAALTSADWTRLARGRVLLFIHGTFSTAHSAFDLLPDPAFQTLYDRYGGRVFAFNHFTMSDDPRQNVEWLLKNVPAGTSLEVDIICHSRGGLVARTLAERPSVFGLDTTPITVRRVVFAAAPNHGTLLANGDHMVKMIDRFTTALNLFPTGPVTETLETLITAVKVIGHGALKGLRGLASMRPDGTFLDAINKGAPPGAGYYAAAADFEPTDDGLKALIAGTVADAVLDRVFNDVPNDLVVPEPGVYDANGNGAFPIPDSRRFQVPPEAGMIHTTIFGYPQVADKIVEWLA